MLDGFYVEYHRPARIAREVFVEALIGAKSCAEMANRINRTQSNVRVLLKAYNLSPPWIPKKPPQFIEKDKLVSLLEENGGNFAAVERIVNIHRTRLRHLANSYGIPLTETQLRVCRGFTTTEGMVREALANYSSIEKAAKSIGVSVNVFRKVMKRWKIPANKCRVVPDNQMKAAIESHHTYLAAARSLGVTRETVRRWSIVWGIPLAKRNYKYLNRQQARSIL